MPRVLSENEWTSDVRIQMRVVPRATRALVAGMMAGLLVGLVGVAPALARMGRLDGKVFQATVLDDTLTFEDGRFNTTKSAARGCQPAPYLALPWDGGIGFRASLKTAAGETLRWEGLIKGSEVDGRVFTTTKGRRVETPFTGTRVPTAKGSCCER